MNLEQLFSRIKEIEIAITNATAQLNAAHGHKSEVEHWIKTLQNAEKNLPEVESVDLTNEAVLD